MTGNRRQCDEHHQLEFATIRVIDAWEALGYRGVGREEHSGETAPSEPADLYAELADNRRNQIITGS